MRDRSGLDADLAGRHVPTPRGGGHQHGAGNRAGLPIAHPGRRHRRRAAGSLRESAPGKVSVERRVPRRADDVDPRPVAAQFLHDQGGDAEIGPLPHFELRGMDEDAVFGSDFDIGLERIGLGRLRAGGLRFGRSGSDEPVAHDEPRGRSDAGENWRREGRAVTASIRCGSIVMPPDDGQLRGSPHGCGDRLHSGRDFHSWQNRCPRRSAWRSPKAARPRT